VEEKKQLTVRFPQPVFRYLAERAQAENKTLNDIVVEIANEDRLYRQAGRVLDEIGLIREKSAQAYGIHPDSTDDLRKLREAEDE